MKSVLTSFLWISVALCAWAESADDRAASSAELAQLEKQLNEALADLETKRAELAQVSGTVDPEAPPGRDAEPRQESAPEASMGEAAGPAPQKSAEITYLSPLDAGDCLYRLHRYEDAVRVYQLVNAKSLDEPAAAWTLFQLGNCYRQLGKLEPAVASYQAMIDRYPESAWVEHAEWLAKVVTWLRHWEDAAARCKSLASTEAADSPFGEPR